MRRGPDDVARELDLAVKQLGEPRADRRQRVPEVLLTSRATEMCADNDSGTPVQQRGQGGQACPDATVIGDAVAVERHVEVGADQDAPARDRQVIYRLHGQISSRQVGGQGR